MKNTIPILLLMSILVYVSACTSENDLDKMDCPENITIEILSTQNTSCGSSEGLIEVGLSDISLVNDLQFSLQAGNFQNDGLFENLIAGSYTVTARFNSDCIISQLVTVENEAGLQIEVTATDDDCANPNSGEISISTTDAVGEVSFSLNNQTPNTTGLFSNLQAGSYSIEVTDDAGCKVIETVQIGATIDAQVVYNIIDLTCATASCHGGSQGPNLSTDQNKEDAKNRILARAGNRTMPPSSTGVTLNDAEIELIRCWAS